ncbi:MAG: alanyl-tRNA editing protein [Candidatus Nanohaloarchaeota archaeon QJJ-7]|nr:alanyl-tRNA editing protein [Candidatus Nanohaloarchaeota archaeon QJJ-7]
MTELLYLPDNDDRTDFEAEVVGTGEDYLVLDGTYFYPEGGGQPADQGNLEWSGGEAEVVDVQKDGGDVKHFVENVQGELPSAGEKITGVIDQEMRDKHRRMHTAQHVMSKIVLDEYNATTAGNQIHAERSRIDFEPADFSQEDVEFIEEETNRIIDKGLGVEKEELPREEVEERTPEGRVNLGLIPDHVDPLRAVIIEDYDVCPCGGTHVDSLEEIGKVNILERRSKGEGVERIEFELEN